MRTLVLICVLIVAVPSISQNEPTGISGFVLMPDGKPINGAFVLIRDYQQPDEGFVSNRWEGSTDVDGRFSFAAPEGCYDIFVSANGNSSPLPGDSAFSPNVQHW
jgi:hypothetical protein